MSMPGQRISRGKLVRPLRLPPIHHLMSALRISLPLAVRESTFPNTYIPSLQPRLRDIHSFPIPF